MAKDWSVEFNDGTSLVPGFVYQRGACSYFLEHLSVYPDDVFLRNSEPWYDWHFGNPDVPAILADFRALDNPFDAHWTADYDTLHMYLYLRRLIWMLERALEMADQHGGVRQISAD